MNDQIPKIKIEINDIQRLDWMIFNNATICRSKDGEGNYWVFYNDYLTGPLADDARKAIDLAMKEDDKRTEDLAR